MRKTFINQNNSDENILRFFSAMIKRFRSIFDEFKPDLFLPALAIGGINVLIFEQLCREYRLPYIVPCNVRVKNLFAFAADTQLRFPHIDRTYKQIIQHPENYDLGAAETLYTTLMVVVYSVIPYKTPWCLLGFLHGLILLAGVGVVALVTWLRQPAARAVLVVLLAAATTHLAWQAYRGSFVYQADSRNPYVYAHPTEDIFTVVEKITDYAGIDGVGESVPINVVCSGADYWPLPWYLRGYAVNWTTEIPARVGPLVVISAELENALSHRLYVDTPREQIRMYMYLFDDPYYVWFRPQVKLVGFVRKDLSDHYQQRPDPAALLEGQRDEATGQTGDDVRPQ